MKIADDRERDGTTAGERRERVSGALPEGPEDPSRSEVLASIWKNFSEFRAYAEELVRIEKDRAKLSLRESLVRFRREALVFFALCTLVVTGSIYTLTGLSAGLASLFEDRPWIGNLLMGLAALGGAVVWMRMRERRKARAELQQKVADYEQRRDEQRTRFGRHVSDESPSSGAAGSTQRARVP